MAEPTAAAMSQPAMIATEAPAPPTAQAPPAAAATEAPTAAVPQAPEPTAMQPEPAAATSPGNPPPPPSLPPADTVAPEPAATAAPAVEIGADVGQMPPAYAMTLADGRTVQSTDIVASGRPVFMVYFATW